jgi:hypothetical protein
MTPDESNNTEPESIFAQTANELTRINGVFACAVRDFPSPPSTEQLRERALNSLRFSWPPTAPPPTPADIDARMTVEADLFLERPPFPERGAIGGNLISLTDQSLYRYLRGLTNLLATGDDERIDARVGQTRIVAEAWKHLIVAVAIPSADPAIKSLIRNLRRVRKRMEETP